MTARGKSRAGKGKGKGQAARRPAPRERDRDRDREREAGEEAATASPPPEPPAYSPDSPLARFLARAGHRRDLLFIALAAVSGAMWFISSADWDIWPIAWIAIAPCLVAVEGASTMRRAVLYGWLSGTVANVGGFYWVTGMLVRFGHLPRPIAILGLLLLGAYQGVVFALFAAAVRRIRQRSAARSGRPLPMALLAPIAMVAFEMLVPFLFPWYLAISQAWVTPVIQIAELTGPVGVSAMLVAVGGGLYDLLASSGARRRVLPLAGAALFAGAAIVFGLVRIGQVDEGRAAAPSIKVGVVQGNISFDEKGLNHQQLAPGQLRGLQEISSELAAKGADLLLWSESSYPYVIRRDRTGDFPEGDRRRIRGDFAPPVVVGAVTTSGGPDALDYNSAVYVDRDGSFAGRFDKIFLLMFGEYVPFRDLLGPLVPKSAAHFERGKEIVTLPFNHGGTTYRLGPMICYEDILPQFGRELAAQHPHLLINLTNDAWYGDTAEPWEHLALSVFRAVEARTDLVRAVNTGVSAFIDANGRVMSRSYAVDPHATPTPMTGHIDKVALVEGGHTFYTRFGDLFGWTLTAAAMLLWIGWPLATRLRNRRSGAGSIGA